MKLAILGQLPAFFYPVEKSFNACSYPFGFLRSIGFNEPFEWILRAFCFITSIDAAAQGNHIGWHCARIIRTRITQGNPMIQCGLMFAKKVAKRPAANGTTAVPVIEGARFIDSREIEG